MNNYRQIKVGALISYIAIGINIIIGLIYTPWMIRQIGQGNYALYTLAISLIGMFTIDFGMSAAVSRFVSKYNAENDQDSVDNFLGMVYKLYIIISAIASFVLLVVYFFINTIYSKLTVAEIEAFKVVYIISATFSIISFPFLTFDGILTSYEKFIEIKICDLFNKITTVVLVVFALLGGFGLYALVSINAVVGLFTILIKYIVIKKKISLKVNFHFKSRVILKEVLSFSVWSTVASFAQRFLFLVTPSILGIVSGSTDIAIFGFANSLANYIFIIANGINGFFLPLVSRIITNGKNNGQIMALMIKVGRLQVYVLGIITIIFLSIGKEFIYLLMGSEYSLSYICTVLFIVYSIICYPQQIANTMVIALNKVKKQSMISVSAAVVNIALSFILSKYLGALGASISICVAILLRTYLLNVMYYKEMAIDVVFFFKKCHLKLLPSHILVLLVSILISWIPFWGWTGFFIKAFLIFVTYCLIMWFMSFDTTEKDLSKSIIGIFPRKAQN